MTKNEQNRRMFLRYLMASPLFATAAQSLRGGTAIASAKDALDVFDFMPIAQKNMSAAHWAYLMTGVDDDLTRDINHDAFRMFQLRTRRFVDVDHIDTSIQLFGQSLPSPILLDPVGSQRAFHAEGELGTARAAANRGNQMILSTVTTHPVEDVAKEYKRSLWFQLYVTNEFSMTKALVERAERAGSTVLFITVDAASGGNRETVARAGIRGEGECRACHTPGVEGYLKEHPMYNGLNLAQVRRITGALTWDLIGRIRDLTKMKVVVKGVMTGEDAQLSVEHGMDGIVISNHGGREEETLLSTIEVLPEVVSAVKGRMPVLIDGGFRRGTDVFKALALGATAIGIGRPYLWGLGAFGQSGVERVLEMMLAELVMVMKQAGTTSIGKITPDYVRRRPA